MAVPGFFELALDRLRPSRRSVLRRTDSTLKTLREARATASVRHSRLSTSAADLERGVETTRPEQRTAVQEYAAGAKEAAGAFEFFYDALSVQITGLAALRRRGTSTDLDRALDDVGSAVSAAREEFDRRIAPVRESSTAAEAPLTEMALNAELRTAIAGHRQLLGETGVRDHDAGVTQPVRGDAAGVAGARPSPPTRVSLHNEPRSGRVGRVPRRAAIRPAAPWRRGTPGRGPGNAPHA
jgi:hypothetical protein